MSCLYLLLLGFLLVVQNNATPAITCGKGYGVLQGKCVDDNECDGENPICGENAVCYNTNGSYYCQCVTGYQTNSKTVNFTLDESGECEDINECLDNNTICGPNANCKNTPGSYDCTCNLGFVASNREKKFNASQKVTCNDINECLENNIICGPNATCENTPGSYDCTCNLGFVASNREKKFNASQNVTCNDINECLDNSITCGPNAYCYNTSGSYFCMCQSGFVASNREEKFQANQKVKCNALECNRLDSGSLSEQIPVALKQILIELKSTCMQKGVTGGEMLQILLEALEGFLSKKPLTDTKIVTALFEVVEKTLPLVGQLLDQSSISKSFPSTRVEMLVQRRPTAPHGPFSLSSNDVQVNSHWETAVGNSYKGFASASLFQYESLEIPHVNSYISSTKISADQFKLNSKVVTIAVTNPNTTRLEKPITLNFSHLQEAERNITCVFWDSALEGGAWSTRGCSVVQSSTNHTVCSCSHLSSFAVLMALYELENVFELQLITWIGLSLSLICLLICILTFWLVRSIQSTRTTIHLHLCISLFIADLIFLIGISQTENKVGCAVVAGLLHFFFLAVFCWMCLEGVQLFRMVVLVFNTTLSRGYLMAAGYGVPALIVIISASVNYRGYGTSRYCWLNLENGFVWSFFGPVCVIIVVNAVFFLITVSKLAQKFNSLNPDLSSLRKIKTFTITAIAQLCVLGTMWIFGCFQFDEGTLVMSYLFTIFNSLQGVLVFIMHCLLSKQVRDEYVRFLTCVTTRQKRSYSEFSTNQSSKSQVSKSIQSTGESRI
ncbi:adhesion G protein-coupled receptor E1 isoform X2 [Pangasianodon hypophthalmus]|uniref:adhesion G protein-coupled receptor E1 isoform X2 n=1 Tax=Pangasianodon hypophthalmus TaxID=310915 RepID=UPI00230806FF|nr:adhesion G protein-coupled receptor E1 isoform X2 [Pangasianodon hypophthalmus]